eukprot:TRINITY_DN19829_c0_g1_i1.p1 TRINITY_DN19829_c0_g1~~TRINITY_DN19829_c0_g1_i1.p1  ORF type:complete len:338 (+),score=128.05 TRINITY_DN19829_c0_g1_i1:351-1364(+)
MGCNGSKGEACSHRRRSCAPPSPTTPGSALNSAKSDMDNSSYSPSTSGSTKSRGETLTPLSSTTGRHTPEVERRSVLLTSAGEFQADVLFANVDVQRYSEARGSFEELLVAAEDQSMEQILGKIGLTVLQKSQACKRPCRFNNTSTNAYEAKKLLSCLAKAGCPGAMLGLAEFYRSCRNRDNEEKYLKKASATGHPLGQVRLQLAHLRDTQKGVERGTMPREKVLKAREAVVQQVVRMSQQDSKVGMRAGKAAKALGSVKMDTQGTVRDLTRAQKLLDNIIDLEESPFDMQKVRERTAPEQCDPATLPPPLLRRGPPETPLTMWDVKKQVDNEGSEN